MNTMAAPIAEQGFGKPVTHLRNNNKRKKRSEPKVFASNIVGQRIVNAMTGSSYEFNVGSKLEERLFKVATSQPFHKHTNFMGEEVIDADGYQINTLFYDTPEQYEKHKRVTLSDSLKKEWYERHPYVERAIEEEDEHLPENLM